MAVPGYVSPPVLASVGVYPLEAGPPGEVPLAVLVTLEALTAIDGARGRLYLPTRMWELGEAVAEEVFPGVYRLEFRVPVDVVVEVAGEAGYPFGLNPLEVEGRATHSVFGPLPTVRLSALVPEEERGKPLLGLAVVSGAFGCSGTYTLAYMGPVVEGYELPLYRHDTETVFFPLYSHLKGLGELFWVLSTGPPEAPPAIAGFQVEVFYTVAGLPGAPRARLCLELLRGGARVGFLEDYVYPVFSWWAVPRLLGERLYEPGSVGSPPASKSILS